MKHFKSIARWMYTAPSWAVALALAAEYALALALGAVVALVVR